MTDEEAQRMRRENDYLKARCAQLQVDIDELSSQLQRTTQQLERNSVRRTTVAANPLGGGQ